MESIFPVVSVRLIAYQNIQFIHQAIESVLMQKINFPIELCIGEDGSTDGTREVCQEYAQKNPELIRLYLWDRNAEDRKGLPPARYNFINTLKNCKGKYVALLDGDDYWTDPLKLQKQVDFLEANPDHVTCFHKSIERNEISSSEMIIPDSALSTTLGLDDLLTGNNFIPSQSCIFRNFDSTLPSLLYQLPFGDYGLHLFNAKRGKIGFIDEVMAVYRISLFSMHGVLKSSHDGYVKAYGQHIRFWEIIQESGEFDEALVKQALSLSIRNFEHHSKIVKSKRKFFFVIKNSIPIEIRMLIKAIVKASKLKIGGK